MVGLAGSKEAWPSDVIVMPNMLISVLKCADLVSVAFWVAEATSCSIPAYVGASLLALGVPEMPFELSSPPQAVRARTRATPLAVRAALRMGSPLGACWIRSL